MPFLDYFNVSERLHARWCRFIIRRYLGHLLEKDLSLDQLSVQLIKGCVQIEQVALNAQYINDTLSSLNLPLRLVDGFIGRIRVHVPWTNLMGDASEVDLSDVQLTFRGGEAIKLDEKDLVSSMPGSVMESLVSSIDLAAQSFKQEEEKEDEEKEEDGDCVHALSKVVDAVVSRFCCNIDDLIVRIETEPTTPRSDIAMAVELKITKLRFMDEQMKECQQEGASAELINNSSGVANVNKHIILNDISLYTDTFSTADLSGSLMTSMHMRREHKKNLQEAGSPRASMYESTTQTSGIYQSCYSTVQSIDGFESISPEPTLISNPVKVAEIPGETTIVLRKADSKFEFDIYAKGIAALVTPSQLELIKALTGSLIPVEQKAVTQKEMGGEPMASRHFDAINRQLDDLTTGSLPSGNALGKNGNWLGIRDPTPFHSIALNDDLQSSEILDQGESTGDGNATVVGTLRVGSILAFLTHEDPLSVESVDKRGLRTAVDLLHKNAERFFDKAAQFKIGSSIQAAALDELFPKDHIRLIGSTVSVSYSAESDRVSTKLSLANVDIFEYLTAESSSTGEPRHNPLFTFDKVESGDNQAQFTAVMRSKLGKSSTVINLGKGASSTLDMSIVDRLSHLLCPTPFFGTRPSYKSTLSGRNEDDLFAITKKNSSSTAIEVNCASWNIDIMIPKVDLRGESSHVVQNLHDEYLRLQQTASKIVLQITKTGEPTVAEITASSITGRFMGDLEKLGCSLEDSTFLYAGGSKGKPVRIALEFDSSNKSLKASSSSTGLLPTSIDDMTEFIKNLPKKEGPFAQTSQFFTKNNNAEADDENIVRAGSREEMCAFARACQTQSDVTMHIDCPLLRLLIPNHHFLELLYNRLVNDFALWQPSAPAFNKTTRDHSGNLDDCFKEVKSSLRNNIATDHLTSDSDEEDNEGGFDYLESERRIAMKARSHLFALQLDVTTATMVMGTEIAPASPLDSVQPAQVVGSLGGIQAFVCYGYHGDIGQTFAHMTTTNATIAQRNHEPTIPKNVMSRDFGTYEPSEVQLRSLPSDSHLREGRTGDDSLGVAMHTVMREDGRVKETTAAIALRLLEFNVVPVKRVEESFLAQLKDIFALNDYDIPGYEMPIAHTFLHINVDHSVLAYDHSGIVPRSPLKYRLVLGAVDFSSTLVPSMRVHKSLAVFERVHLHMTSEKDINDDHADIDDDEESQSRIQRTSNMVHIAEIGLFQLELLIANQSMVKEDEKRNCPLFELRCTNDQIKAWVCSDSLVALINTAVEVAKWTEGEKATDNDEEEMRSSVSSSRSAKSDQLPSGSEHCLQQLVESACQPFIDASHDEENEVAYAKEAFEERSENDSFDYNLLEDAMRDMSIESDACPSFTSTSSPADDEFLLVEDIPGSGITSSNGEPRIRLIDPDNTVESGDYFYNYVPEHIGASGDFRGDSMQLPADHAVPVIRYRIKDISVLLHVYGGNDLGTSPDANKTYSVEEYREGSGRGQSVASEARGGQYRDHSVSVVLELAKCSWLHQLFDTDASVRSMNFFSVQDVIVHDRLTLSNIKHMMYPYATAEQPRRTCAPMIAVRMVENHEQEGKLRVSMLPIRLNIDQDTLEFVEDFVQALNTGLTLPETAKLQLNDRPLVEVPEGITPPQPQVHNQQHMAMSSLGQLDDLDELYGLEPSAPPLSLPDGDFLPSSVPCNEVEMEASVSEEKAAEDNNEDDRNTICSEARKSTSSESSNEAIRGTTFFKEFAFSPGCAIYIDYQGKSRFDAQRSGGAVLGVLRGIGQLNRTEIALKSFEHRNGLLGVDKCVAHAISEWQADIMTSIPGLLTSVGPLTPLVQIGKGITDLFWMPVSEARRADGHVVKGLQRGTASFGFSTAAALVDLIQRVVGVVQVTAESVLSEMTPSHPSLNNRNRRPVKALVAPSTPRNVRHGMQLAYDLIADEVRQTREDLERAGQEDRASGRSSMNSVLRYATPAACLRPLVITTKIGYQLLGGLKNQLRPDQFDDEQHKWRHEETDRAGTTGGY